MCTRSHAHLLSHLQLATGLYSNAPHFDFPLFDSGCRNRPVLNNRTDHRNLSTRTLLKFDNQANGWNGRTRIG